MHPMTEDISIFETFKLISSLKVYTGTTNVCEQTASIEHSGKNAVQEKTQSCLW
jgi:hypothetical protein